MSLFSSSINRQRRLAFTSCVAMTVMAIPIIVGGQVSAGMASTPLTATVTIDTRDYNGSDGASITGCSLTGVIAPDDVTCVTSSATGTFSSSDVGVGIAVSVSGLTLAGFNSSNYAITLIEAVGTIEPVTLIVTPDNLVAAYGDLEPSYTFDVTGFVNGEDKPTAGGYFDPTCDSDYDQGDVSGDYSITCIGGSATNYIFDTTDTGTLSIGAAVLTVTPINKTITYGAPEPTFDNNVTGFVDSETALTASSYSAPSCDSDYEAGDPVGSYTITCIGGTAAEYTFDTAKTAILTVNPFVLGTEEVVYSGQIEAQTRSSSDTSARVTLSASITADFDGVIDSNSCIEDGPSVSDATVTFRDLISGRIIVTGVPIAEVAGNCEEGIATIFATLSTGQNGSDAYVIEVTVDGSFSGANDYQVANAIDSTTVLVTMPAVSGTLMDSGELVFKDGSSYSNLGTEGSLTSGMDSDPATTGYRFVSGTRKVLPKGQAVIVIPAADGGFYYVKTNSITSMSVGATVTTVFAKANITLIGGTCATTCAIDGNVSLRLDIKSNGDIAYTVQSSKTSVLYYSNDWYKDGRVWKTAPQTLI